MDTLKKPMVHTGKETALYDQRVAVDTNLNETEYSMCFACREPLTKQERRSGKCKLDSYCPYCVEKNKS